MERKHFLNKLNFVAKELVREYKDFIGGKISDELTYKIVSDNDKYEIFFYIEGYWKYIESGRKKGTFPNVNSIKDWIKEKNITSELSTDSLAYVIGRGIKKNGIKPSPFFKVEAKVILDYYDDEITEAFMEDEEEEFDRILSQITKN